MRILGWLLLIPSALAALGMVLLERFPVAHTWHPLLIAAATFIPLLWLATAVALVGLTLVLRGWGRLLGVLALVAALLFWGWDLLPVGQEQADPVVEPVEPGISAFVLNTQYGRAAIGEVLEVVEARSPDVLVFLEHTSAFDAAVSSSGLRDSYPHAVGTVREDPGGTMILSRSPLVEVERAETIFDNIVVATTVDGVEWTLAGVHTVPPQMGAGLWAGDGRLLRGVAERHLDTQFLMLGDFNAIEQHHTMRLLSDAGMVNSMAGLTGVDAWRPTWPAGGVMPPFARIDHVLHGPGVSASPPDLIEIEGTDHLGLFVSAGEPSA